MTTPNADSIEAPAPAKPASRWEDFIDIFYAPSTVFERRQNQNPWPTILIVTVLFTLVTVLTFNALSPIIENELRQQGAQAIAKNPQMTQDMVEMQVKWGLFGKRWGGVFFPIGVLIGALFVWILGKIIGAKQTYQAAMVVVAYSAIISIVQAFVVGAQGLVLDVSALTSLDQLSIGPARFVDKAAMSPILYTVLKQLDLFVLWSLVVTAIGVRVTGKVDKSRAIAFAVIWWTLSTLIMAGFAMMSAPKPD